MEEPLQRQSDVANSTECIGYGTDRAVKVVGDGWKRRRRRTTKRMTVRTMGGVWHCVLLTLMVPTGCFAQDTKRQQLIGPKFFPLERLLAITFSLLAIHDCEESAREANTADLYSEVHTLPPPFVAGFVHS